MFITKASELTIDEKLRLLSGKDMWHIVDFDGKLPVVKVTDASMGIRTPKMDAPGDKPSVAYPSLQVLANTWNKDIVKEYATCVADDCLDYGCDVILGPGVNIKRNPLCGRNFEYFSEDPFLAGTFAYTYVKAAQEEGAATCLKHFCANNQENNRFEQSSEIDNKTLREVYLKPFEMGVKANPMSVMSSYNRINGTYGSEYKKGYDILRNEYGFEGMIMSDWDAVRNHSASALSGCDLEMPFKQKNYDQIVKDYQDGLFTEADIDANVQRIIDYTHKVKALHEGKTRKYTVDERIAFTKTVEAEGIVLLKNNGVLPLNKDMSVAICGAYAQPCGIHNWERIVVGGGSGRVTRLTPMFDIPKAFEERVKSVVYERAFLDHIVECTSMKHGVAVKNAAMNDVNIVFAGTGAMMECEGFDRETMKLPSFQEQTILDTAAVNPNTVVVLFAGSAIDMSAWIDKVAAVVYAGFPGEKGSDAVVDVLMGTTNPCGKLSETFPMCYEDTPDANCFKNSIVTVYDEGLDVGYKYYERHGKKVLFPFGYGLSYSTFVYDNLNVNCKDNTLNVNYTIENASDVDGKEISEIYIRPLFTNVYRPTKELKGFEKTFIGAHKTAKIATVLTLDDFRCWSDAKDDWFVPDGVYEICIGASSQDIKMTQRLEIKNNQIIL